MGKKEFRIYEHGIEVYNIDIKYGNNRYYRFYDVFFEKNFKENLVKHEKSKQFIDLVKKTFYNYQYPFNEDDVAIFIKNGKYGLINKNNQVVLDAEYDYFDTTKKEFLKNGFTIFWDNKSNKLGLISLQGEILLEANYDGFFSICDKLVYPVKANKKGLLRGLFNIKNKKMLIEPIYKELFAHIQKTGLLEIKTGYRYMLIDYNGRILIPLMNPFSYAFKAKKFNISPLF